MLHSKRDMKLMEIMSVFNGKTYGIVLAKTLWLNKKTALSQALNRITILREKHGLVESIPSGLVSPKNVIFLTKRGREFAYINFGIQINKTHFSPVTIHHNISEMIVWYWLTELGNEVKRTTIVNWGEKHDHTPDLYYESKDKKIYVEIEDSKKSVSKYSEIFSKIENDNIDIVIYFFKNKKDMESIGKSMPIWKKLYFVNIEEFIINSSTKNKIGFIKQSQFLKELKENK